MPSDIALVMLDVKGTARSNRPRCCRLLMELQPPRLIITVQSVNTGRLMMERSSRSKQTSRPAWRLLMRSKTTMSVPRIHPDGWRRTHPPPPPLLPLSPLSLTHTFTHTYLQFLYEHF